MSQDQTYNIEISQNWSVEPEYNFSTWMVIVMFANQGAKELRNDKVVILAFSKYETPQETIVLYEQEL